MAKFNEKVSTKPNAISYEGGAVFEKNPVEAWMNFLFSSYLEDKFYEHASNQLARFHNLTLDMINTYGAEFVAKAALFARNELGMRSVSQYVAAMLNAYQFVDKRVFFRNYPHRADDAGEIFSIIDVLNDKRRHATVRGIGDYISSLSPYTLGKYKMNGHEYNMYDIINITHAHSDAIDAYKANLLETPDTWEVAISTATDKEKRDGEWIRLVEENRLGYMALVRNLNNILSADGITQQWVVDYLVPQLTNKTAIKKSLIFPYQIYSAYKNLKVRNTFVVVALETAFRLALDNMPQLKGDTLIFLDVSGSMTDSISYRSNITIRKAGAVYAACIALTSEHSEIIKFATYAKKFKFNKIDNVFDQIEALDQEGGCGWGTNIDPAYSLVDRGYDRIMLISDMQIMNNYSYSDGRTAYNSYCRQYGATPIYSFDLGNYRTQTDNPNNPNVHLCTSLSEKTLKFISLLEDGQNLVAYINDNYDYR